MSKERECAESLRGIVGKTAFSTYLCRVKRVEGATCTVVREMDGMEIKDVRINASITENQGFVVYPKENSHVLITDIDGDKWYVSQYSEIDRITVDAADKIIFNGGDNRGLVKIEDLVSALQKIERDVNKLKTAFTTWEPAGGDGGDVLKVAATEWAAQQLALTQVGDLEDTNIQH